MMYMVTDDDIQKQVGAMSPRELGSIIAPGVGSRRYVFRDRMIDPAWNSLRRRAATGDAEAFDVLASLHTHVETELDVRSGARA